MFVDGCRLKDQFPKINHFVHTHITLLFSHAFEKQLKVHLFNFITATFNFIYLGGWLVGEGNPHPQLAFASKEGGEVVRWETLLVSAAAAAAVAGAAVAAAGAGAGAAGVFVIACSSLI